MTKPLDATDLRIIDLLQQDGRISNIRIARTLGVSEATVRNRLQKLLEEKVVQIVAVCDPFKIGFGIVGSISINIDPKKVNTVLNELNKLQEVWYIALTTGSTDVDIDFNVRSLDDLRVLLYDKITRIDGILRTETSVIMEFVKRRYDWGTALTTK
ncbi:MAG: Lrp/AsnC family transcriptional regulator [Deltaproteobacteria bacterium]|nr:Lrp/AsnC family transcriptional regulator [Deltaproteobacteria bacterium]